MSTARAFVPRPLRRGLVSQEIDGELLLYVQATHQASSLNASASQIWAFCDGARSVKHIATETKMTEDVVANAMKQLADAGLLENGAEFPRVDVPRRRVLVGVGLAAPIIMMILAPKAAAAASSCVPSGSFCIGAANTCCSNPGVPCPNTGEVCP
jgi:hypothetical protein